MTSIPEQHTHPGLEDRVSRLEREHDQIIERLNTLPTETRVRDLLDALRRELQGEIRTQYRWTLGLIFTVLLSQLGLIYWVSSHFVARP